MDRFIINGGNLLEGNVQIKGAKNAILPIIACCIMIKAEVTLHECPHLSDIEAMLKILRAGGGIAKYEEDCLIINCKNFTPYCIDSEYTGALRASLFVIGPLLSAFKSASVSYPGGCEIGLRPIDLHITGLKSLSVSVERSNGKITCDGINMKNSDVFLDFPSVGATENIIMASVLGKGVTRIYNCAKEPEICDLANFINVMGGKVYGAGTDKITVEGVVSLSGGHYFPTKDRIVAGTFLIAGALMGKEVVLDKVNPSHLLPLNEKLIASGASIILDSRRIIVKKSLKRRAVKRTETRPYPGFPTDLQPQFVVYLSQCRGCSVVVENMFENRFNYTAQLQKMGADITVKDRVAIIKGVKKLTQSRVEAKDLRGGVALVLASICAEGESEIWGVRHIDRGYDSIEKDLEGLGVQIKRLKN
ncbi:MAG: UDP-N-acetylglucosamine 1-carboxyvinyltransferase [Clostridiales bacterium]|nr:UDP-N-acetylglucosamine 1-carboxyvinyltransferase [Clostridiales bacterium]